MGFTQAVSRFHQGLASIMRPLRGQELTTADIERIVRRELDPQDAQWIQPSDHCKNHTCEGACECAGRETAVFERIERGRYRVR